MDISSDNVLRFKGTNLSFIDFVLVYKECTKCEDEEDKMEDNDYYRRKYMEKLREKGLIIHEMKEETENLTFVLIQSSLTTLYKEAERLNMRMPIDVKIDYDDYEGCLEKVVNKYLLTDNEEDFLSAPFFDSMKTFYKDHDKGEKFFRPGLRFLVTYSILINASINDESKGISQCQALQYLVNRNVYSDYFIPHSPSKLSKYIIRLLESQVDNSNDGRTEVEHCVIEPDERAEMHVAWVTKWRYQPLWKIRNYFGEKTAFYFAWLGHMILCLCVPMIFGLIVFIYGLYLSITRTNILNLSNATSDLNKIELVVDNMLNTVKQSFDNILTPIFAGIICLWGTIFTETWKRLSNKLAFEWDVSSFVENEPERPQFVGTDERNDPVTNENVKYFPSKKQSFRYIWSLSILLGMLFIVFGAVIGVIVYRVVITVDVCPGTSSTNCLLLNMIVSSILNAVAIIVLGKVYDKIAVGLTNWENHRTQTDYDNALILKLFCFQFINSYSSLFYIAFFKGKSSSGILNAGSKYTDTCGVDNNCMAMLSFQVLILMLMKPLPKLFTDIFIPFIMKQIKAYKKTKEVKPYKNEVQNMNINTYLHDEMNKPTLGDFTISEYMEKVLQYGYLVLFAASFPLAPLLAFLNNCFDLKFDAYRLLWTYRKGVPEIVQNIGIWQSIVETLNLLGVISTVFIIAFTSSWGNTLSLENKLIFVIIAEHVVLLMKYILNVLIPDISQSVKLNMKREKFHLNKQKEYID